MLVGASRYSELTCPGTSELIPNFVTPEIDINSFGGNGIVHNLCFSVQQYRADHLKKYSISRIYNRYAVGGGGSARVKDEPFLP